MNGHHQNCPDCSACRDEAMKLKAELGIEPVLPSDLVISTEHEAVRDALLQFRYCDGRSVDPRERNLVANLLQLAEKYNATGQWIAAELEKLLYQVARMPKTAPEHPNWFLATMESRLQRKMLASTLNLPTAPSQEAAALLAPLMEHATLPRAGESFPAELRARQFLKQAHGNRFDAVQNCIAGFKGSTDALKGQLRLDALWYMLDEGWGREFPVSGTVVKFEPRSETGQSEGKKRA